MRVFKFLWPYSIIDVLATRTTTTFLPEFCLHSYYIRTLTSLETPNAIILLLNRMSGWMIRNTIAWEENVAFQIYVNLGLLNKPNPPMQRSKNPTNECPRYDTKQSDCDVSVMLELWGTWSTPSLPSRPGPLWPGVVSPNKAQSMGLIEPICALVLN